MRNIVQKYGKANIIIVLICMIAFVLNSAFVDETALMEIASDKITAYLLNFLAGCQGVFGQMGSLSYVDVFEKGQWWRLITHIYLHAGIVHLAANMIALLFAGRIIEKKIGSIRYALLFHVYAIISGIICCLIFPAPSVGASAGIFGMIGMVYVLKLKKDEECNQLLSRGQFIFLIAFSIFGNIGLETLTAHCIPFVLGIIIACLAIKPR